ncbi:hypothetical protein HG15A2_04670 [Adhaeretor mobilis]|uniref:Uncharacterized protein n=2 Tax=Adhaeretor mobilis TaxID=1930276 RepID=A0A517MQZ8_9BACT|nr:hypothetical protein HG15A2_04670 [Adhaeretor mobilis]
MFANVTPPGYWRPECLGSPDLGDGSILRYFHSLKFAHCHEAWAESVPGEPQDWGLGPKMNEALHDHLISKRTAELESPAIAEPALVHAADGHDAIVPSFLVVDTQREWGIGDGKAIGDSQVSPPSWAFTGCGKAPLDRIDHFEMNIPSGQTAHRRREAIALVLTQPVAEELGRLTGLLASGKGIENLDDYPEIINAAFAPTALDPGDFPSKAEKRIAVGLDRTLYFAPAIWSSTNSDGRFAHEIDLDGDCPGLEWNTLVVLFLGPGVGPDPT